MLHFFVTVHENSDGIAQYFEEILSNLFQKPRVHLVNPVHKKTAGWRNRLFEFDVEFNVQFDAEFDAEKKLKNCYLPEKQNMIHFPPLEKVVTNKGLLDGQGCSILLSDDVSGLSVRCHIIYLAHC